MRSEMGKRHIPGASVVVVRKGKVSLARGYGLADKEKSIKVTPGTVFYVGSVTKQFTATAIMMLVEEGKIALDEKAVKYLPKLPMAYGKITVRQLLNHTSGIKRDFKVEGDSLVGDRLYDALASAPLDSEPGEKVSYSTTNYILLGMMLERIFKKPLGEFLHERIFKPLGMTSTKFMTTGGRVENLAKGYEWQGSDYIEITSVPERYAAGALVSNINDMAKWDEALYGEKPVKKATLEQMWTAVKLPDGSIASIGFDDAARQLNVGFGWFISDYLGHRVIHHGGNIDGYSAQIDRFINDEITIIVLCNNEAGTATALAKLVADNYVPNLDQTSIAALNQQARFAFYQKEFALAAKLNIEAMGKGDKSPLTPFYIAQCFSQLGENDKAFNYLERAIELGFGDSGLLKKEPALKPLQADSRWPALLRRVSAKSKP